jgi:hypothetical protein
MSESDISSVKSCPDCGETKSVAQFGFNKRMPDGRARYCKPCFGVRSMASYRKRMAAEGKQVRERPDVPDGFKYCPHCGDTKSIAEFGRNRSKNTGLTSYCKPCHNVAMAENKAKNHGSVRSFMLKRRYGLTAEQVDEMCEQQGGVCLICLSSPAVHVDHDHETGLVRGLLCFSCNGALGQFDDEAWRLRLAADYLEGGLSHSRLLELELGESVLDGFTRRAERTRSKKAGTSRHYRLRQRYGINGADEQAMIAVQRGLCAICSNAKAEHVDHDHETGRVRGVLCPGCNTGMGQLKDDPATLRRAADYLSGALVRTRPMADGRTRLSFTIPDVDPATVTLGAWEVYRAKDGHARKGILELRETMVFLPYRSLEFAATYPHAPAYS